MSKLKSLNLFVVPLCLKIRGRIVGAFSKTTMAVYIAFGLLVVVSVTFIVILANLQNNSGIVVQSEQSMEEKVAKTVEDQPATIAVAPSAVPEVVTKGKEKQPEQSKDVAESPKIIEGKIQLDFGWQQHPVYNDWRYHTGIDISGSAGQLIQAVHKGQVTDVFRDPHSGLTVVIKDNVYNIYYGSLAEVMVAKGSFVSGNQVIGKMGSFDAEPYDHLHLAIKKGEQYIDPKLIISIKTPSPK
jgi:murein DD-endopeptidase MepM/ murein hydrolase activator NlpD